MQKSYLEQIIRSVKAGETMQRTLDGVNVSSYRAKVAQINRKDGFQHYSIIEKKSLNIFGIRNNASK